VQGINILGGGDWMTSNPTYAIPANVPDVPLAVETTVLYDETHQDGSSISVKFDKSVQNGRPVDYYVVQLARDESFVEMERQDQVNASVLINNSHYVLEINNLIVGR
jgi:hypothetical protein